MKNFEMSPVLSGSESEVYSQKTSSQKVLMNKKEFTGFSTVDDDDDLFADPDHYYDENDVDSLVAAALAPQDKSGSSQHSDSRRAPGLLINYNERFCDAGPAQFRDDVVLQTMSILIGYSKPNALLVGAAGTGKTKIVEDIAWRLAHDDSSLPEPLRGKIIYELPLSSLVAGSGLVGALEGKLQAVIEFAEDDANQAILFIDEIHMLMAPDDKPYANIAQILKPALARGRVSVIGATTLQEANDICKDPAFARRFSRVVVHELTRAQTVQILQNSWQGMQKHYGRALTMENELFEKVARVADEHLAAGSHRPDNAITLLDRVCATCVVKHYQTASDASAPICITAEAIDECASELYRGHAGTHALSAKQLKQAMSGIKGQDHAIAQVAQAIERATLGIFPREKPLTLLFAGPSGVGKTEMAKIIARELTGCTPITLNMAEYYSGASINRIIGSPAGYAGCDSHTELPFDALESNPNQVILLDELEKCTPEVQRLFLSVFDEGRLQTAMGKTIDFSKAIIIATTNATCTTGKHQSIGFATGSTKSHTDITADLSRYFDTEFLNRFERILMFNTLDKATYRQILQSRYAFETERIRAFRPELPFPERLSDQVLDDMVAETYLPAFGARNAVRAIRSYLETMALEYIASLEKPCSKRARGGKRTYQCTATRAANGTSNRTTSFVNTNRQ